MSEEDWSYNGLLFNSVLTDETLDQESLTDAIMSRLNLDRRASEKDNDRCIFVAGS